MKFILQGALVGVLLGVTCGWIAWSSGRQAASLLELVLAQDDLIQAQKQEIATLKEQSCR